MAIVNRNLLANFLDNEKKAHYYSRNFKGGCMRRIIYVALFVLCAVSLFGQTQENIKYALNEIAKPLGGVANDAILQDANTLGGMPHFRITGGINLRTIEFRDPEIPDSIEKWTAGAISFEGRVGLFKGKSFGPTFDGVGSTDLLLRLAFYPIDSVSFVPLFGIGVKTAIIRESMVTPAVSVSIQFTASQSFELEDAGEEVYAKFNMKVFSMRADVSKNLLILTGYAGLGFNINTLDADIWYMDGLDRVYGEYTVSPSAIKLYGGIQKRIFLIGLHGEVGLSGDALYGAFGLSAGM
jgi:hypothetical protein